MSNLSDHLRATGQSQRAFAATIGVDPSIVSRLCKHSMLPGLDLAVRIERATGGAVMASSWVPERQPQSPTEDAA